MWPTGTELHHLTQLSFPHKPTQRQFIPPPPFDATKRDTLHCSMFDMHLHGCDLEVLVTRSMFVQTFPEPAPTLRPPPACWLRAPAPSSIPPKIASAAPSPPTPTPPPHARQPSRTRSCPTQAGGRRGSLPPKSHPSLLKSAWPPCFSAPPLLHAVGSSEQQPCSVGTGSRRKHARSRCARPRVAAALPLQQQQRRRGTSQTCAARAALPSASAAPCGQRHRARHAVPPSYELHGTLSNMGVAAAASNLHPTPAPQPRPRT
eukprot:317137-Chlamydomonas_euryale.AAC.2